MGRMLAVHSVAVIPEYQNMKLGGTIVNAYLQRMSSAAVADRVSLLAHREFVGFYKKLGFEDEGLSSSELYGGGWVNMVCYSSFLALFDRNLILFLFPKSWTDLFLGVYMLFTCYLYIKIHARMWWPMRALLCSYSVLGSLLHFNYH